MFRECIGFISLITILSVSVAHAAEVGQKVKEDKTHVRSWNLFASQCLSLHKKQVSKHEVRVVSKTGGYRDKPDFYIEKSYLDKKTGKLLSRIQWEKENPGRLHSIEVFVRDKQGRVIRDYAAAYLPGARNAPVQALINLHAYNKGLHAFRQFDASKDVIYEFCEGSFNGKKRQMRLFEDDIANNDRDARELLASPFYKACFAGIPSRLGKFIQPR